MIEKILLRLIKKERVITIILAFIVGALATAFGVKADVVKKQFCESKSFVEKTEE